MIERRNTGTLFVPAVRKVHSSTKGYSSLWNLCQETENNLNLWRFQCIINGRYVADLQKDFRQEKTCETSAEKQLHWWNGIKERTGKWLDSVLRQRSFLWRWESHTFLLSVVQTTFTHRIFYNVKCLKMLGGVHCTTQNMMFIYFLEAT